MEAKMGSSENYKLGQDHPFHRSRETLTEQRVYRVWCNMTCGNSMVQAWNVKPIISTACHHGQGHVDHKAVQVTLLTTDDATLHKNV